MKRMIVIAGALALVLAGCEMGAELNVNPDGSGTFAFVVALPEDLLAAMPAGEDPFAEMRSEFDDSRVAFTFEEFSERGLRGMRATVGFSSVEDLENSLRLLAASEGGSGGAFGEDFSLIRDGEGWSFSATGEAPDALGAPATDGDQVEDPFGGQDPFGELAGLIDISFKVTLPGAPIEHNATEATTSNGRTTFVWKLDATSAAPVAMRASSTGGGAGGFPVVPVGVGIALVGLGVIVAARLRKPAQPAVPVFEGYGELRPPREDELTG